MIDSIFDLKQKHANSIGYTSSYDEYVEPSEGFFKHSFPKECIVQIVSSSMVSTRYFPMKASNNFLQSKVDFIVHLPLAFTLFNMNRMTHYFQKYIQDIENHLSSLKEIYNRKQAYVLHIGTPLKIVQEIYDKSGMTFSDKRKHLLRLIDDSLIKIFRIAEKYRILLLLENNALAMKHTLFDENGTEHYLSKMVEAFVTSWFGVHMPKRIGLCLDTCHLFASGIPIQESIFNYGKYLTLIHMNPLSHSDFGNGMDRHSKALFSEECNTESIRKFTSGKFQFHHEILQMILPLECPKIVENGEVNGALQNITIALNLKNGKSSEHTDTGIVICANGSYESDETDKFEEEIVMGNQDQKGESKAAPTPETNSESASVAEGNKKRVKIQDLTLADCKVVANGTQKVRYSTSVVVVVGKKEFPYLSFLISKKSPEVSFATFKDRFEKGQGEHYFGIKYSAPTPRSGLPFGGKGNTFQKGQARPGAKKTGNHPPNATPAPTEGEAGEAPTDSAEESFVV